MQKEEGEELTKKEGIAFFEVSAKTDENIKNICFIMLSYIWWK